MLSICFPSVISNIYVPSNVYKGMQSNNVILDIYLYLVLLKQIEYYHYVSHLIAIADINQAIEGRAMNGFNLSWIRANLSALI